MADSPPTSRIARTRRFGGLVAGQGLRWAGTRAANTLRSDEKADAATGERAAATARELVKQLGQMRGAAMKIGQVLSTVDFTAIPESEREEFKQTLATLRDDVPPLPFNKVEKLLKDELGEKLSDVFDEFDEEAFAAASIGQVHKATTTEGKRVAVKIQYPGIAEAVETDLRNMQMVFPLVKRLAPGLDVKALATELRERIADELDYEVEAQNHRAMARAWRGHPFVHVPPVDTAALAPPRARHRADHRQALRGDQAPRRSAARPLRRDRLPLLLRHAQAHPPRQPATRTPATTCCMDDGRVGFLDFGLMRVVDADYLEGERALAQAVARGDAAAVHAGLAAPRLPPAARHVRLRAPAGADPDRRRVVPRARLPPPHARLRDRPHRPRLEPPLGRSSRRCAARRSRRRRC